MRRSGIWWTTVVRLTLAALLFGALSPAIASALFANRPELLARMIGVPAQAAIAVEGDICHQDASGTAVYTNAKSQPETSSGHAAHSVICSLCLTASSQATVPAPACTAAAIVVSALDLPLAGRVQSPPATPPLTHHSRAPPAFSHTR